MQTERYEKYFIFFSLKKYYEHIETHTVGKKIGEQEQGDVLLFCFVTCDIICLTLMYHSCHAFLRCVAIIRFVGICVGRNVLGVGCPQFTFGCSTWLGFQVGGFWNL